VVVSDSAGSKDEQANPIPGTNSEQSEDPSQHSPRAPVSKLMQVSPADKQDDLSLSAGSA